MADSNELFKQYARKGIEMEIERLQGALREIDGLPPANSAPIAAKRGRPPMSDAQRKALSRAMKARWREKRAPIK